MENGSRPVPAKLLLSSLLDWMVLSPWPDPLPPVVPLMAKEDRKRVGTLQRGR